MTDGIFEQAVTDILEDLGTDAIYKDMTIRVSFKNGVIVAGGVETRAPMAECRDVDITGVRHTDTITINAVTYRVIGIEPSGYGTTMLILSGSSHG